MVMILLGIIGFICFLKNKKKVELDNKNKLFDKVIIKKMFTNKGILVYSLITIFRFNKKETKHSSNNSCKLYFIII